MGTSEREGESEDTYLRLNLASVLWFGRQTTFIFLQQTHTRTHTANSKKKVTSTAGLSPVYTSAHVYAHTHTHTHVSPQPRIGLQLQIQGAGGVTHFCTPCQSNFISSFHLPLLLSHNAAFLSASFHTDKEAPLLITTSRTTSSTMQEVQFRVVN